MSSVPNSATSTNSAARSATIDVALRSPSCGDPDEEAITEHEADDNVGKNDAEEEEVEEEEVADSSDEYDTDLDLPLESSSPPPVDPDKNPADVTCQQLYLRACSRGIPAVTTIPQRTPASTHPRHPHCSTYPQCRLTDGLAEREMLLKYRSMGREAFRPLTVALPNNLRIERLDLQHADIGPKGAQDLAIALADNITVSYLNVGNNNLGTEGAQWISSLLLQNKLIKHLCLEGNNLKDDAAPHLAVAIEKNTSLSILDLSRNELCDNGPKMIAAALGLNTGLETFRLSWNHVRGKGAVAICQSLKYNETLKLLDISWNGFGYEGALAMAEALRVNTTLKELDMTSNRITWRGALLFSGGLKENMGLEILRLGGNPLTTTGCLDVTEAVTSPDSQVKFLDLTGVPIIAENEVLADAIRMRKDFRFLHGGIVLTPDVLGERIARKKDHMEVVMEYLRQTCIRPLEMLRDYDKKVNLAVTTDEFVGRLVKAGIPLHKFEMRALARAIAEKRDDDDESIDYPKMIESVTEQILRDRFRIKRERFLVRKTKQHHKRILASGLPAVPYDRGAGRNSQQGGSRNLTGSSPYISAIDFSNLDLGNMSLNSLPSLREGVAAESSSFPALETSRILAPLIHKPVMRTVSKPKIISMSAPLGDQGKKKKKRIKRKRKKKVKHADHVHVTTLVSAQEARGRRGSPVGKAF